MKSFSARKAIAKPASRPILTRQDKVFFLNLSSTVGDSLNELLDNYFDQAEICPAYSTPDLARIVQETRQNYRFFRGPLLYDGLRQLIVEKPKTITFLNDPVDQAITSFADLQGRTNSAFIENELKAIQQLTLAEYVYNPGQLFNPDYRNHQTKILTRRFRVDPPPAHPNRAGIDLNPPEGDLDLACRLLTDFEFVGLANRFEDALSLLTYTFGWRPLAHIPALNPGSNTLSLPPGLSEYIQQQSHLDLALYHFAQRLFQQRFEAMLQDLLHQHATRYQASLKLPLPPQVMYELLEKDYRQKFRQQYQPVDTLRYGLDQALRGDEWYSREHNPDHHAYRWSGPNPVSFLDFALAGKSDLRIKFKVMMAITPEVGESLKLEIEGQTIPLISRLNPDGTLLFEGLLPRKLLQKGLGFTRLYFKLNQTLLPTSFDPANQDPRRLGIVLNWLEISPSSETFEPLESDSSTQPPRETPNLLELLVMADVSDFETYHVGDEAMLETNLSRFRQYLPGVTFTVISRKPAWTAQHYAVEAVSPFGFSNALEQGANRQLLLQQLTSSGEHLLKTGTLPPETNEATRIIIEKLTQAAGLIISGGGNICSSWPGYIYERVALIRLAHLFNKPALVLGQTIGPRLTKDERLLVQEVLLEAALVGVRELASLALVQSLGVGVAKTALQLDDAFYLEAVRPPNLPPDLDPANAQRLPLLLVTVPPYDEFLLSDILLQAFATQLVEIAQCTGSRLLLVPHQAQAVENAHLSDVALNERLAGLVGSQVPISVMPVLPARQVCWLTAQAALVVSMRYHPLIFGLAAAVPCFGIYTDDYTQVKLQGALAHAGLEEWSLPLELAISGGLVKGVIELWEARAKIRQHLNEMRPNWERDTEYHWSKICALLGYPLLPEEVGNSNPDLNQLNGTAPKETSNGIKPEGSWREAVRLFDKQLNKAAYRPSV